jgi:hypothetical protein
MHWEMLLAAGSFIALEQAGSHLLYIPPTSTVCIPRGSKCLRKGATRCIRRCGGQQNTKFCSGIRSTEWPRHSACWTQCYLTHSAVHLPMRWRDCEKSDDLKGLACEGLTPTWQKVQVPIGGLSAFRSCPAVCFLAWGGAVKKAMEITQVRGSGLRTPDPPARWHAPGMTQRPNATPAQFGALFLCGILAKALDSCQEEWYLISPHHLPPKLLAA